MKRAAKGFAVSTGAFCLYFGPWFPASLEEARGFVRRRAPLTNEPQTVDVGSAKETILVVVPVRISETLESIQTTLGRIATSAAAPQSVRVAIVHEQPEVLTNRLHLGNLQALEIVKGPGGGRGPTQNVGARSDPSADILVFCHADTLLPEGFDTELKNILNHRDVLMTAFSFGLDEKNNKSLDFVVKSANMRSRFWWMPYGDQCLAMRREVFDRHGGFKNEYKMMEDFDLVRRIRGEALRKGQGRIVTLDSAVISSAR